MNEKQEDKQMILDIAGVKILLEIIGANWQAVFNKDLLKFQGYGAADLKIKTSYGSLPEVPRAKTIFDSGGVWKLLKSEQQNIFILSSNLTGEIPYGACFVNNEFSKAELYLRAFEENSRINPLEYPLDEVLMVHLLSRGRGVIIHGCGLDYQGKGILMAGVSGSGKTTVAGLWSQEKQVTILSDDRVIIKQENGELYMYGTPWHGDAGVCTNKKVKLESIYFLSHDAENNIKTVSAIESVSKLMVCCFTTFWDKTGMEFTLSFIDNMAKKIPCFDLGFVPDKNVLEFLKEDEVLKC